MDRKKKLDRRKWSVVERPFLFLGDSRRKVKQCFYVRGWIFAIIGLAALPFSSFGYDEIAVRGGGTLTGTVRLNGPIPPPAVFRLSRSPFSRYCEKISDGKGNIVLEEYHLGPEGGMQETIVAVQQVNRGKPFTPIRASFFATDCMFHPAEVSHHEMVQSDQMGRVRHVHPLVTVFQDNQPVSVINKDPIFHNGQIFQQESGHILLNFPVAVSDRPMGGVLRFQKGKKIAQMICGMHEYMQTYGLVVDNPYYAKTKRDGQFVIDQLPEGRYQVLAWHPHFKPIIKEITVSKEESISLDFVFASKGVGPRAFEAHEGLGSVGLQP